MKFTFGQVCVCVGLIVVGAFALSVMHLDWALTDEGWGVSNEFEVLSGTILLAGVMVASAILLGAGVIARVVAAATHRSADDAERVSSHADPWETQPGD